MRLECSKKCWVGYPWEKAFIWANQNTDTDTDTDTDPKNCWFSLFFSKLLLVSFWVVIKVIIRGSYYHHRVEVIITSGSYHYRVEVIIQSFFYLFLNCNDKKIFRFIKICWNNSILQLSTAHYLQFMTTSKKLFKLH